MTDRTYHENILIQAIVACDINKDKVANRELKIVFDRIVDKCLNMGFDVASIMIKASRISQRMVIDRPVPRCCLSKDQVNKLIGVQYEFVLGIDKAIKNSPTLKALYQKSDLIVTFTDEK